MFKHFLCAMICTAPEIVFREEEVIRENVITFAGLLRSASFMQANDYTGPQSRGPDEGIMAEMRESIPPPTRSINGKHFDCVRHILSKLEETLSKDSEEKCIPTADEIDEYFRTTRRLVFEPDRMEAPVEIRPYALAHSNAYGRRRLFVTKLGYLGLGPASIEVGDTVWIVPGLNLPLFLRHCLDTDINVFGPQRLNLVGEAYVHEIVRGEAAEKLTDQDLTDFILT
jgi:hypothetical protein